MITGTVILAHGDTVLLERMERAIGLRSPQIHVEKTASVQEAVLMQAFLRADVIFLEARAASGMTEHVIWELKRDIVNPYIIVQAEDGQTLRRWQGLGADEAAGPTIDVMRMSEVIAEQLARRGDADGMRNLMAERLLQRIFMEYGIPCSLKGYRFLKCAIGILSGGGRKETGSMNRVYEEIGMRHGCSAGCVERNIRYVIDQCWSRSPYADGPRPGNAEFIAQILEETTEKESAIFDPKISVYCSQRRVFK